MATSTLQFIPQVSWVRRRDWHILTSGTVTYTKEQRYDVHHPEGSTEWTLEIKYVKQDDAGTYECQVSMTSSLQSPLTSLLRGKMVKYHSCFIVWLNYFSQEQIYLVAYDFFKILCVQLFLEFRRDRKISFSKFSNKIKKIEENEFFYLVKILKIIM